MSRTPKRKCWDIAPVSFELVDVAALTGAERELVSIMFLRHTDAAQQVIDELPSLDIPPARARDIMLSCSLVMAGVEAHQLDIVQADFSAAAARALEAAKTLVEIGSDIEGEA